MKTVTFEGMKIRVDRPKGFIQEGTDKDGKSWKRVYRYDYGFIPKTKGGDGEGLDVFLGPDEDAAEDAHWVIQRKDDGSFDEYKVFLGFKNRKVAKKAYLAHIPERYYGGMLSMTVQMMRAMLGQEPAEKLGMVLELSALMLE